MNPLDATLLQFLNQFARKSSFFDHAVAAMQSNNLLKAGALIPLFWWFWFRDEAPTARRRTREYLLATLAAAMVGLFLAREMAAALPFRVRPMYVELLKFRTPFGADESFFVAWSSFPSDHAVLLCALAAGLWKVSRPVGALALAYVLGVVCAGRVYMGIHHPTDILVGAAIGIGLTLAFCAERPRQMITTRAMDWHDRYPAWFYGAFFLLTYQIADMFNAVRAAGQALKSAL